MSWLDDWSKRIKLTVDNTNVDDNLSDFPVLIKISDSSGITSTDVTSFFTELGSDANRKKIAITTLNGITQCYVEIERFDYSNSVAWLWVKVPSVVSGSTTEMYLYYDSTQPDNITYIGDTTETPAQNVWDSNFKLVMHMAQDPNGDVADAIKDSTSNTNHGTPGGAMTSADLVDGKIGKAIDFDGGNDHIGLGTDTSLNITTSITIETIINKVVNDIAYAILGKWLWSSGNYRSYYLQIASDNKLQFILSSDGVNNTLDIKSITNIGLSDTYIAAKSDNVNASVFVGTNEEGSTSYNSGIYNREATPVAMGVQNFNQTLYSHMAGIIEEVRISNIARSAAWLKATHYSNWDGLVSFGAEETEAVNYISGYVKEGTIPVNRQVYLHNRDTGELITSTTSSGVGGYFYMETTYSGAHYVVCLDDAIGVSYNDLIYGNIYPATTSG